MSNEIVKANETSVAYQSAVELHKQIMTNGSIAATAMVDFCKGLKQMRDEKLYIELGYESFEDYSVKAVGLKQRQAYAYVSVIEKLGDKLLQSTASLGITKLEMLTGIPAIDREDVIENTDLESMSTREVKELVEQLKQKGDQLQFITEERDKALQANEELKAKSNLSPAEIEKLTKDAVKEAVQKEKDKKKAEIDNAVKAAKADADKKIKEAADKATKEAKESVKKSLEEIESEKAAALAKTIELEKKLSVAGNKDTVLLSFLFEEMKEGFNKMLGCIKKLETNEPDIAVKYKAAIKQFLELMSSKV